MITPLHPRRYLVEVLESRIAPATFIVTTVGDSGPGSLRQAILDANALEGADGISFNIAGEDLQIISPFSALPAITDVVTLSGVGGLIRIDGTNAGTGVNGLTLEGASANGSKVEGLQIANFSGSGVVLENISSAVIAQNIVSGNDMHGLHRAGASSGAGRLDIWGNRFESNNGDGIRLENVTSLIGNDSGGVFSSGSRPGNTIEENGLFGIRIVGGTATIERNVVRYNGQLESPTAEGGGIAVINSTDTNIGTVVGVTVVPGTFNTFEPIVEGNTVSGNIGHGVAVIGSETTGTVIGGNRIRNNTGDGIHIDGAPDTELGFIAYGYTEHPTRPTTYPVPFLNVLSENAGWGVNAINGAWDTIVLPGHTFSENGLGTVFIEDDRPRVSLSGATLSEGDAGVQSAAFVISLDRTYTEAVKVSYRTVDGTAKAGEDFGAVEGVLEFAPGEITKSVIVTIFGDTLPEASEIFHFDIAEVSDALVIPVPRAVGAIGNDDAIPTVSIQNTTVIEGEGAMGAPTSIGKINVTLSHASLDPVTVTFSSLDGGINPGSDYTPFSTMITFAPGVTSVMHSIVITNDNVQEAAETFQVALSNPTGAVMGNATATLTIVDDDTWTIESEPLEIVEGNSGTTTAIVKLRLVNSAGLVNHEHPIRVLVSPEIGGTVDGSDFSFAPTYVTFSPGELEATFSVGILGDGVAEQNETVLVRLSEPIGAKLGVNPVGQLTILNDDPGLVSISPASIVEGDSGEKTMVFTVDLSVPMNVPVSVNFQSIGGTALEGVDFEALAGELIFAPGEKQQIISIAIYGDLRGEDIEVFTVHLTGASGATLKTASAIGTIINDEPAVNVEDFEIVEGESGTPGVQKIHVPVRLSHAMEIPVSVEFQTVGGTALVGSDYLARSGSITFAPGQTVQFIELEVISDMIFEGDESFYLVLSDVNGADIGKDAGEITIVADEVVVTTAGATLSEGDSGAKWLSYLVRLSKASDSTVTVNYATVDGTAQAGSDYSAASGVLTFAPGTTLMEVRVQVLGDDLAEANETFDLVLSQPLGASLQGGSDSASYAATIENDDEWAQISSGDVSVVEGDSGAKSLVFTVTLSQARASTVTVNYATVDASAKAGGDYTAISGVLTFAPGQTSAMVAVPILGDDTPENHETFGLSFFGAAGATTPAAPVIGTIENDDSLENHLRLTIGKSGREASWVETDGDIVSLVSNKPIFSPASFDFRLAGEGSTAVLERLEVISAGKGTPSLHFSVTRSPTGDGMVNVGEIDASGLDLKKVTLPGTLGSIQAGDSTLKTKAISKLVVNAFGRGTSALTDAPSLLSEIVGSVGSLTVQGDFVGADLHLRHGTLGLLKVGGDIHSASEAAPTRIIVDGSISKILVGGDIRGLDSSLLEIKAANGVVTKAAALGRFYVAGDVVNTDVRVEGAATQKAVRVGEIRVVGDWRASSLLVGADAGEDGWAGTADDSALQSAVSRIARIRIDGNILGTDRADDHFGFGAGQIGAFQIAGQKLELSSKNLDIIQPSAAVSDVLLRELAGNAGRV